MTAKEIEKDEIQSFLKFARMNSNNFLGFVVTKKFFLRLVDFINNRNPEISPTPALSEVPDELRIMGIKIVIGVKS